MDEYFQYCKRYTKLLSQKAIASSMYYGYQGDDPDTKRRLLYQMQFAEQKYNEFITNGLKTEQ